MRVVWLISLFIGVLASPSVNAQSTGDECGAIDDSALRMVCYDSLFRTKTSQPVSVGTGNWTVRLEQSRITDKTDVFLSVDSDQGVPARFGGAANPATLMLRCKDNTTSFTIWFGGEFMASSGGYDRVTYRIDAQSAVDDRWEESTNNEHMGIWSGSRSIPLIKSLFGAQNFLVQATPFNESSVTLDFKVGGLEEAVKPLREACSW